MTPAQQRIVQAVADDMQLAARAWNAVKIPGSPTTAADLHKLAGEGKFSHFAQLFLGEQAGSITAGLLGLHSFTNPVMHALFEAAGMAMSETLNARRSAGIANVDRLATEMVLNPELGRVLLERAAAARAGSPLIARLRQKIIALTAGFGSSSQRTPR